MKTKIRLSFFSILCVSIFACKNKQNATTASSNTSNTQNTNTPALIMPASPVPVPANPQAAGTTRFVVSFFSESAGIDGKTNDAFVNFLNTYPKKVAYSPTHWGREGEIDYCLALTELSATEQADFIRKANTILSKSKLVHSNENAKCEHGSAPLVPTPVTVDDNYRLVVSFYSEGQGTDYKTKEEFEKFLNSQTKKISFEPTIWGREGETDYCLKLSELTSAEQMDFVRKAKDLLSKSKLVHVDENAKCVHKH
jgi:hypothetical protein